MAGWKAYTFVGFITSIIPAGVLISQSQGHVFSIAALAIWGLLWFTIVYSITIPLFTSPLRHLPEPPGESWWAAHGFSSFETPPGYNFQEWMNKVPNQGLIHFRGFFHCGSTLLATTPEVLQEVLNTHAYDYEKPATARRLLSRLLGAGLVTVEGQTHKVQRKSATPAFQGKQIRELVPTFWVSSCRFIKAMKREWTVEKTDAAGKRTGVIEINDTAGRSTLDMIGSAGLGRDFNSIENSNDELARIYSQFFDPKKPLPIPYIMCLMCIPQAIMRRVPLKVNRTLDHLRDIARQFVVDKKQLLAEKAKTDIDILSILMRNSSFDDDSLVSQLLTFLAAGHETTSSSLTWACYLLGKDQKVQDRLRAEVQKVMGGKTGEGDMNAALIDEMPFLHAVVHEGLRLYPTVPHTVREALKDTTIGDVVVPKGTAVIIAPMGYNRITSLWGPDAMEFNPDRWIDKDGKVSITGSATSQYSFGTFLHGPRSCIGQNFARMELKCLLSAMMLNFRFELMDPSIIDTEAVEPAGTVTIKPKGGMYLRLTEL